MPRVAVVGNLARDRIDGGPPQPGGCPFFAALALRLLAREGQIVTRCSDRDRVLFDGPVRALGVPVAVLSAVHTAGFDHVYEDEIRTTTVTSIGDPWTPRDAVHLDPSVTWVHVAPLLRSDFPAETLAALAAGGRRLSLDAQGLVREARLGPLEQSADFDPATLAAVSVLKLSEEEARIVGSGAFDASTAESLGVEEILVTLGSRGEAYGSAEPQPRGDDTRPRSRDDRRGRRLHGLLHRRAQRARRSTPPAKPARSSRACSSSARACSA
jgi:hypothetical protein